MFVLTENYYLSASNHVTANIPDWARCERLNYCEQMDSILERPTSFWKKILNFFA